MSQLEIHGTCDPRFKRVQERFARHFEQGEEIGASFSLVVDGRSVVDIWAGHRDEQRSLAWERDTIANVYSTTKGMAAIALLRLVERGRVELEAPVARYWPEFAQAGKADLPVRYLLTHQAGLPAVAEPLPAEAIFDHDRMARALAAQAPWWKPGTKHGYHAITYGWLIGEVVRRVTGETLGRYFRREVAEPLGADFWIGLGPEHDARTADLIQAPPPAPDEPNLFTELMKDPESVGAKAFMNPNAMTTSANSRAWRAMELPSANGHANGRALARIYGALARGGAVDGVRVLEQKTIDQALRENAYGPDLVITLPTRIGLGFMLSTPEEKMGPNPRAFGHGGAGGSLGFADPDAKIGFGYVMNQMKMGLWLIDPRPKALIDAVYSSL